MLNNTCLTAAVKDNRLNRYQNASILDLFFTFHGLAKYYRSGVTTEAIRHAEL